MTIAWARESLPVASGDYRVGFGDGYFLLLRLSTTDVWKSTDGKNWTAYTSDTSIGSWTPPVWTGTHWVCAQLGSSNVYRSTNGENWTSGSIGTSGGWGWAASDGAGNVVIVPSTATSAVARSSDHGATWAQATGGGGTFRGVTWFAAASKWLVVNASGARYSSDGGATWSNATGISGATNLQGVAGSGSAAVAVDLNSDTAWVTTDGTSYSSQALGASGSARATNIVFDGTSFVVGLNDALNARIGTAAGTSWSGEALPASPANTLNRYAVDPTHGTTVILSAEAAPTTYARRYTQVADEFSLPTLGELGTLTAPIFMFPLGAGDIGTLTAPTATFPFRLPSLGRLMSAPELHFQHARTFALPTLGELMRVKPPIAIRRRPRPTS